MRRREEMKRENFYFYRRIGRDVNRLYYWKQRGEGENKERIRS